MAFDLQERLRRNNERFMARMSSICERYNYPFEDDVLICMETLTYHTPNGPKKWVTVSDKMRKKWNRQVTQVLKYSSRSMLEKDKGMQKHRSNKPVVLILGVRRWRYGHHFYIYFDKASLGKCIYVIKSQEAIHEQGSPEYSGMYTSDVDEESDDGVVSIRIKDEDTHFQNPYVDDGKIQEPVKVQVDVIVQDDARKIPKWIMMPPRSSLGRHLALPTQEQFGTSNEVAVCSKGVESSAEWSSSRPLQLQSSGVPVSPNKLTIPRRRPFPEPNETSCDSLLENSQSAHEESSLGDATLADLYPAMVEVVKKFMTKHFQRKASTLGCLRHKRCSCRRRPTLSVSAAKIRGFRPPKLKRALPSIRSSRSEDTQNKTSGNENRELCAARCSSNNLSGLVPSSHIDTNETKGGYSDLSSEHHFVSGKGQKVSEQTVFPTDTAGMRERFLVQDELQSTVSLKNFKCKESEEMAYKRSFEHRFITLATGSELREPHLVNESKAQKTGFPCDTSELRSSPCSSYGNRNTSKPITNCSLARPSNTSVTNREKIISERLVSFQCRHSSSSLSVKQSPSYIPQIHDDAFEKLYQLCTKEIQKPFVLTRPPSKFQNLEKERRLVKSNSNCSNRSDIDIEFDRIYEELCSEAVPKIPEFQRTSNLRQYKIIQIPETVNALVNSPVQSLTAIPRVKRLGNFQNDRLCSPEKRLKHIPAHYSPSTKCQQVSHRKSVSLQRLGVDFLSTDNSSNPSSFESHNCQSQDSGFCAPSAKTIAIPDTFLQGSGIEGAHSGRLKATKNYSSPRKAQKCRQGVSRRLSYTDGKD